jgi:hypothetical protein
MRNTHLALVPAAVVMAVPASAQAVPVEAGKLYILSFTMESFNGRALEVRGNWVWFHVARRGEKEVDFNVWLNLANCNLIVDPEKEKKETAKKK